MFDVGLPIRIQLQLTSEAVVSCPPSMVHFLWKGQCCGLHFLFAEMEQEGQWSRPQCFDAQGPGSLSRVWGLFPCGTSVLFMHYLLEFIPLDSHRAPLKIIILNSFSGNSQISILGAPLLENYCVPLAASCLLAFFVFLVALVNISTFRGAITSSSLLGTGFGEERFSREGGCGGATMPEVSCGCGMGLRDMSQ